MKFTAIIFAALIVASNVLARESEDPSYEPMRGSSPGRSRVEKAPAPAADPAAAPVAKQKTSEQAVEVVEPAGPRVKYIVDGKPIYEGDPMIAEIEGKNAKSDKGEKKSSWWFGKKKEADAPKNYELFAKTGGPSEAVVEAPAEAGPKIKYILDGKPVYEGAAPVAVESAVVVQSGNDTAVSGIIDAQPTSRQATAVIDDDLTADKPGTRAAAESNPILLEGYAAGEHLNTRAQKCYTLLAELKTNVETVSRCMDNRGKENARLVHTADEISKNISDLADIWPNSEDFIDRCSSTKRCALILCDELSRSPWRWAQVRWSFDAFLKDVRGFREYAHVMADAELKQVPKKIKGQIAHAKDGSIIWEDVPDPEMVQLAAKKAADQKAKEAELAKLRRNSDIVNEAQRNRLDTDLRNAR